MSLVLDRLRPWILAIRPKTLTAALVPIAVGTALSYSNTGRVHLGLSFFALMSSIFIQIGTNLINDALDFKKGADTSERLGPQRVTQMGFLSISQVWWGGMSCFLLAAMAALPLLWEGGTPILVIGLISLVSAYAYTGGPYPLAYLGLGDLFVLIFFGWVSVLGMVYLHTGKVHFHTWIAGSQIGLLATVLIAINNLRDHLTDRLAQKKTLAVRCGLSFVRAEIMALCLLPFSGGIYWYQQGFKLAAILPFLSLPLALSLIQKVQTTEPSQQYNQFLAQGAALHFIFGVLLSFGLCFP